MPETLVEVIATLDGPTFKEVVDDEIRRRVSPTVANALGTLLPEPGKRVRVRNQPPVEARCVAIYDALQDPAVVERWFMELTTAKRRIERQLAARASDLIANETDPEYQRIRREYHKWRGGSLRFLNALEDRIDVARTLTGRYHVTARVEAIAADRRVLSERVVELEDAIERHRDRKASTDEIDLTLYELLDEYEDDEVMS